MIEAERARDSERHGNEMEALKLRSRPIPSPCARPSVSSPVMPMLDSAQTLNRSSSDSSSESQSDFDVSKYIRLVPPFRETEMDSYFIAFERVAAKLRWPKDMWALLLQCNLSGKAQEVTAALPIEQSLDYDAIKMAVTSI